MIRQEELSMREVMCIVAATSLALLCLDPEKATDKKPKVTEIIDFPVDKTQMVTGVHWVGMGVSGEYLAAHYSVLDNATQPSSFRFAVWAGNPRRLVAVVNAGNGQYPHEYGIPAGMDEKTNSYFIATEDCIIIGDLKNPSKNAKVRLPKRGGALAVATSLLVSPDSKLLVRVTYSFTDKQIVFDQVDNVGTAKWSDSTTYDLPSSSAMAVTSGSIAIASSPGSQDRESTLNISLVKIQSGKKTELTSTGKSREICSLAVSKPETYIACGTVNGTLGVWNIKTEKEIKFAPLTKSRISTLAFGDSMLAVGSFDRGGKDNVWLVSLKDLNEIASWSDSPKEVLRIAFADSGRKLLVASSTSIHVYSVEK